MIRTAVTWLALCMVSAADLKFPEIRKAATSAAGGAMVTVEFPFKNEGTEPVTISRYNTGCGCLAGKLKGDKKTYGPSEAGAVIIEVDASNLHDVSEKQLDIWVAGKDSGPAATLTVEVTVPELIRMEPKTVIWSVGEEAAAKKIVMTIHQDHPLRLIEASGAEDAFTTSLKAVEEGKKYELIVTPKSTEAPKMAAIRILTDSKEMRLQSKVAYALVKAGAAEKKP